MSLPLFSFRNISLSFGQDLLFDDITAQVSARDKVCLVGRNGSGKSTLLKIMAGEIEADKGELYYGPGVKIGYLAQMPVIDEAITVYEYVLQNIKLEEGELIEHKSYLADIILEKLHLSGDKILGKLSGGKLRRADLAKVLVADPDILFLDEPTNHLDIASIEWLEEYLSGFAGGLMVVSHDRAFLRNISNRTIWLDRGKLLYNNKGYSDFERFSDEVVLIEQRELSKLGKELDKENLWLQQGVTARRKRNQQRLHGLYELREKLKSEKSRFNNLGASISLDTAALSNRAKLLIEMKDVAFSFTDVSPAKEILKPFSLSILKGETIGVMGMNGAGKSTLIKLITGDLSPTSGKIKRGNNLEFSYLDQGRSNLEMDKTLWETLCPNGGSMVFVGGKEKHVIAYLKDFLFDSKQANSNVSTLSGGQQNRLLLAMLLRNPGNFLILDEPTNDLDMDTLDMLVEILSDYQGTLLIVSHDRDFLEKLATRTIIIEQPNVHDFAGGYYDYAASVIASKKEAKINKAIVKKEKQSNKLTYKDQRELDLLPKKIEQLNIDLKALESELNEPNLYADDAERFNQLSTSIGTKRSDLETLEIQWLELEDLKNS
jgi:ABC transport system ATP-binding/permease protein